MLFAVRSHWLKFVLSHAKLSFVATGAAGNFLAPISGISENAFKTVLEIDTVSNDVFLLA